MSATFHAMTPHSYLLDAEVSGVASRVLSVFWERANQRTGDVGVLSASRIAERARCHVSTVWRAVSELMDKGLVQRKATWSCVDYGMRGPNRWQLPQVKAGEEFVPFGDDTGEAPAMSALARPAARPASPAPTPATSAPAFYRDPLAGFDGDTSSSRLPELSDVKMYGTFLSGPAIERWHRDRWDRIVGTAAIDAASRKAIREACIVHRVARQPFSHNGLTQHLVAVPPHLAAAVEAAHDALLERAQKSSIALTLARSPDPPS